MNKLIDEVNFIRMAMTMIIGTAAFAHWKQNIWAGLSALMLFSMLFEIWIVITKISRGQK